MEGECHLPPLQEPADAAQLSMVCGGGVRGSRDSRRHTRTHLNGGHEVARC
jgi:hypothetical protein